MFLGMNVQWFEALLTFFCLRIYCVHCVDVYHWIQLISVTNGIPQNRQKFPPAAGHPKTKTTNIGISRFFPLRAKHNKKTLVFPCISLERIWKNTRRSRVEKIFGKMGSTGDYGLWKVFKTVKSWLTLIIEVRNFRVQNSEIIVDFSVPWL